MRHRRNAHLALATVLIAFAPLAHALDAAGVAPALEAQFAPTTTYLDCPFHHDARTCVLVPGASSERRAYGQALAFVRALPGVASLDRQRSPASITFVVGDTAYRLDLARSRARPGATAATLTFAFDRRSAFNVACHRTETLFDDARLASLSPAGYAAMATAVACHGADPVDARSRTPLVMAVRRGNLQAVRVLLRGGADPNHITLSGWTPLLFAARDGTPAMVEALLRAGADPSYIAPDGTTVGTLEPFNARLSAVAGPFGASGPAAWVPAQLADPGARLATTPGAVGSRPASRARAGRANADAAAPGAASTGGASQPALVGVEVLALITVAALAIVRHRLREPPGTRRDADAVLLTVTQADLPAMPVPGPFQRQRAHRRLEPDPRADERAF